MAATIVSELCSVGANVTRAHYLLSPRLLDALDTAPGTRAYLDAAISARRRSTTVRRRSRETYAFQSDYLQRTFAVLDRLPFMNGAIYWTLREFAEGPGWTGGAVLPAGYSPDGLHRKGLIQVTA